MPAALYLRLGNRVFESLWPEVLLGTAVFAMVAAIVFRLFGMYRRVWRYVSMSDLIIVVKCATVVVLVFLPLMFLANRLVDMPRSVPVIQWLALVAMLGGPRFTYRLLKDQRWNLRALLQHRGIPALRDRGSPVLLLGASDRAALFIRAMSSDRDAPYRVVGVLDEIGNYLNRSIHNVPVLDTVDRLEQTVTALPGTNQPGRSQWLKTEATYYLRIANAQVLLGGDAEVIAGALRLADEKLRETGDPTVAPVRAVLSEEIAALEAQITRE